MGRELIFFEELEEVPKTTAQQKKVGYNPRTKKTIFYSQKNLKHARAIWEAVFGKHAPKEKFKGALYLNVIFCFKASKTNKAGTFKTTSPDTDNLIKMVKDVMQHAGYFKNDAQVAFEHVNKIFSNKAGVYVELSEIDNERVFVIQRYIDIKTGVKLWE